VQHGLEEPQSPPGLCEAIMITAAMAGEGAIDD
jgi:hypothetical protein